MDQSLLEQYNKIRTDPWEFARLLVKTKDEKDRDQPIKPFPSHYDYLKLYFRLWQRERLMAVPKSRRMFLSWATMILYLHDTMFNVGRQTAIVSRKENDADDLLERMKFIIDNIPEGIIPRDLIPRYKKTFCSLEFPDIESRILAFPSGADQLRSYAFSGIMADEAAFWPDAEDMYAATFPTIETSGRMTMISSAAPGFFKKLVFDQLDDSEPDIDFDSKKKFPMDGIEVWKNPKNKFTVFQIHYTANPEKRSTEYKATMKSAMPTAKFMQEFEISWETFAGKVVYPDWNKNIHGSKTRLLPHIGSPILIGIDFGLTPCAILAQMHGPQLVVFDELITENMGAERFTELLKRFISTRYPSWNNTKESCMVFIDPAGLSKNQNDETTCAQKLAKHFKPIPGAITFEERRTAVEHFLCRMTAGKPNLIVDLTTCKVLTAGFEGGYHFSDAAFEIEPTKIRPVKNEYSHPHDAFQYMCTGIIGRRRSRSIHIPEPTYKFERVEG